jgi:hypothetical protein
VIEPPFPVWLAALLLLTLVFSQAHKIMIAEKPRIIFERMEIFILIIIKRN